MYPTFFKNICLSVLMLLTSALIAQQNFRVCINDNLTPEDAAKISIDGKMPKDTVPFKLSANHDIDLDDIAGKKMKPLSRAVIVCEVWCDQDENRNYGIGGDWYYNCYVNGEKVLDCNKSGNVNGFMNPTNFVFPAKLKKGKNHIAIFFRRGNASWYLSFARMPGNAYWPATESQRKTVYRQMFQKTTKILEPPYLMNLSANGCRIGIEFNKPLSIGLHLYAPDGKKSTIWSLKYGQVAPESNHVFTLDNLKPDTAYKYEIVHLDPAAPVNGERLLASGNFRTYPDTQKEHMFYAVNDLQVGSKAVREAFDRIVKSQPEIRKADFLVSLGDVASVIDDFRDVYFDSYISYLRKNHNIIKPLVVTRGNHEYRGAESSRYTDYFGLPYSAFRVGDVFYIVLDVGEDAEPVFKKSSVNVKMLTRTADYFREQRSWLKKMIESPECKTAKYRVVLAHAPPFEFEHKYFSKQLKTMTDGVFYGENPKCKIDLWLCGHTHSPYRYDPVTKKIHGAMPRKTRKSLAPTEWDKKAIRFPVYVCDGPGGAGETLSVIQVKAHDKGFTIKQSSLDGKVLDHVTYTPGKPAQVHQTGYKPYPGK